MTFVTNFFHSKITYPIYLKLHLPQISALHAKRLEQGQSLADQFRFMNIIHRVWNVLHWSRIASQFFSQTNLFVHLVCITLKFRKLERITKRQTVSLKIPWSAEFLLTFLGTARGRGKMTRVINTWENKQNRNENKLLGLGSGKLALFLTPGGSGGGGGRSELQLPDAQVLLTDTLL